MTDYRVVIPEERGKIVSFEQRGLPGVARVNSALREFEPKVVFSWHLSLVFRFEDLAANRMPSPKEREVTEPFCDRLEAGIVGEAKDRPNAVFLARVTVDGTQELVYRIYDPEPVSAFLERVISEKAFPREFEYRIKHDPEWTHAEWHLNAGEKNA